MPLERHHNTGSDLSALGSNLANLIVALAGTPASLLVGGLGLANRVVGGAPRKSCGREPACIQYTCNGSVVRHHYRYCCVPPCYGRGRGCS
jgi:hypothetical protein